MMANVLDRIWSTRKNRRLAVLCGVALLSIALAGAALTQRAREMGPKFEPRPWFPELNEQLHELAEIGVEDSGGTFHVRLVEGRGWIIPERNSFPADPAAVRAAVIGVANLELVEPKTARADFHHVLGLAFPGGDAVRMVLRDYRGEQMADILVGRSLQSIPDTRGRSEVYVRRTGEDQTWLARGSLVARPELVEWLDRNVLFITRDRIQSTTITPEIGPRYRLHRESNTDPDFQLLDMPSGRELLYQGAPDAAATAVTGFDFEDVQPADGFDFNSALQAVTRTFDGLTLTVKIVAEDEAYWASLSATAETMEKEEEAAEINARASDWAFKLPAYTAESFLTTRESLLRPAGAAASID